LQNRPKGTRHATVPGAIHTPVNPSYWTPQTAFRRPVPTKFCYDSLYRLTSAVTTGSANYPQWGLNWTYDRYGNRLLQSSSYDTLPTNSVSVDATTNHINSSGYGYDASGNMTNDGYNTLVYDAENRVTSATNSGASGTYTYDGNGLRVEKVSSSTTTVYIFSGSKVIAEYDNGAGVGSPSREYIYASGALLAKIDSSGTKYYHQDQLSNRLVTDSNGNTVEQLGTFPFGESWYNATNEKWLFTTYERDFESGNDYAMARSYISRLARMSSPDPLAGAIPNPQSLNRYSYTQNIPISAMDPSGEVCTMENISPPPLGGNTDEEDSGHGPSADAMSSQPEPAESECGGGYGYIDFFGGDGTFDLDGFDITNYFGGPGFPIGGGGGIYDPMASLGFGEVWTSGEETSWTGIYFSGSAFLTYGQASGGPGPGGKKRYTVNLKVLNDCLSKMGIKTIIDSLTPSTPGGYGKASGKGEDAFSGGGYTVPITVANDAHTYNAAQIGAIANSPSGYAFGFTDPFHPYTNYTNNNNNAYGTVVTQAWELGNSLWRIQAGSGFVPWPSVEPGKTLDNCVRTHNGIQPQ
jgi:RHS repeat-associated protein